MRIARIIVALVLVSAVAVYATALGVRLLRPDPFAVVWQKNPPIHEGHPRPLFLYPPDAQIDAAASEALRHPIVADAVNTQFHAMFSNGPGGHVRLTSMSDGRDLAPPTAPGAGVGPLLRALEQALRADGRDVPEYLSLVADEYAPAEQETARFAVSCYWKGELSLGSLPGVLATRTGSVGTEEVVEVRFDPGRVSRQALALKASSMPCYRGERPAENPLNDSNQQQYHLWLHKTWHYVPLTSVQATRVNAALVSGESPERFCSPTQLEIHRRLQQAYDRDPHALDQLETLKVDRSPEGLPGYATRIAAAVGAVAAR